MCRPRPFLFEQRLCYSDTSVGILGFGSVHLRTKFPFQQQEVSLDTLGRRRKNRLFTRRPRKSPSSTFLRTVVSAEYTQHTLDHQLYYLWKKLPGDSYPSLCSMIIIYVDDFLMTHDVRYDRNHVLSLFTWGSQEELSREKPLEFKGKEIHLEFDEKDHVEYLRLTQEKFISTLSSGKAPKNDTTLRPEDLPEFRSVAGSLQWLSGQTRPDVAATVNLHTKIWQTCTKQLIYWNGRKLTGSTCILCRSIKDLFSFLSLTHRGRTLVTTLHNMAAWFWFVTRRSRSQHKLDSSSTGSQAEAVVNAAALLLPKLLQRTHQWTDVSIWLIFCRKCCKTVLPFNSRHCPGRSTWQIANLFTTASLLKIHLLKKNEWSSVFVQFSSTWRENKFTGCRQNFNGQTVLPKPVVSWCQHFRLGFKNHGWSWKALTSQRKNWECESCCA